MKNYTVFHIDKGKGSGGALGNHIDRTEGKEHTYLNADNSKTRLNMTAQLNEHSKKPLQQGIKDRIKEGYTGERAIRNDAVKYLKVILSGSHEQMKKIEREGKIESWAKDSIGWLSKQFGKENIVKAVVHLDEKTPHIHAVIVPLIKENYTYKNAKGKEITVKKGALSAKEVLRSPAFYRELHTDYARTVGVKYNLARGEERKPGNAKTPVTTLNEFYHQVNKANDFRQVSFKIPTIDKPSKIDMFRADSWTESQNEKIRESLKTSVDEVQDQLSNKAFKTAAEVIREQKYQEDERLKKQLVEKLQEAKKVIEDGLGDNIILRKNNQALKENEALARETLRNLLESRYTNEQIKKIAKDVGARIIDGRKGLGLG